MARLLWRRNDSRAVLLGGSVRTGKDVLLTGEGYAERLPGTFTVNHRYGELLRRFRRRMGKPAVQAIGTLAADAEGATAAQAGPIALISPGRRLKWRLYFADDLGNLSEELHVSRLGTFRLSIGPPPEFGAVNLSGEFTAVVDPRVRLSLVTPWDNGGEDFRDYVKELAEDLADEGESQAETFEALLEFMDQYLPAEPPPGWEIEFDHEEFDIEEGGTVPLSVNFRVPTPGSAAFALQMTAEVDGEALAAVSEPMVLHSPEDGGQGAVLLGGDDSPGGDFELEADETRDEITATGLAGIPLASQASVSRRPSPAG